MYPNNAVGTLLYSTTLKLCFKAKLKYHVPGGDKTVLAGDIKCQGSSGVCHCYQKLPPWFTFRGTTVGSYLEQPLIL